MTDEFSLRPTRVTADGVEIVTYRAGAHDMSSDGDIVLCHGTPWSVATWLPLVRLLAETHRVFLWDMPGYGRSISESDVAIDLPRQSRRLAALIDHWRLDRPHVVAHDIGGAVALGAHLFEASEFASLYLLDVVTLDPWGSAFFRLVAENETTFAALPANLHAALVREYIAGAARSDLALDWVETLTLPWLSRAGQRAFYRQIAQLDPRHTRPLVERLAEVRCPTHIGWGDLDPWIPVEQASQLAAKLPGATGVSLFPRAGHLVPLEATTELRHDLARWLTRST